MDRAQCYDLLGLSKNASMHEIRSAYRRLALEYHPDKDALFKDGTRFKLITEAYQTLRTNNHYIGNTLHYVHWNETSYVSIREKILSWDFYLCVFDGMTKHAGKIMRIKPICCNLTKCTQFAKCYDLTRKHFVMPAFYMASFFISPVPYEKMSKILLKYLGLRS